MWMIRGGPAREPHRRESSHRGHNRSSSAAANHAATTGRCRLPWRVTDASARSPMRRQEELMAHANMAEHPGLTRDRGEQLPISKELVAGALTGQLAGLIMAVVVMLVFTVF